MTQPLRWGFLGASRIGRKALAPAMLAAGQTLVAVGARDLSRARDFADAFAAPRAYGSYAEVIADPEVQAVYIALTNEQHLPWTLAALRAGKHVLCEKPLALNAAEVSAMQQAEAETGSRVMEAYCHIFHPQFARLRSLIAEGAIGRLLALQASFVGLMPEDDFRWQPALGLVDGIAVLPHYNAFPEALSACIALQAPRGGSVFGIDEDTAVVGRNGAWQVHGAGRVTVWRGRRRERFRRGEAFRA